MEENVKLVPIATASQLMEATTRQVELGSCGIDSELDGEFTVAANPLLSNAVGGIRILVAAQDAERAKLILEDNVQARAREEAAQKRICPKCKSENGKPVQRPNWAGILAVITMGAFSLFYPWPKYRCPDCKYKWK